MSKIIPDISRYQSVDWAKFRPEMLIQKCTEATSYFDPTFTGNRAEAKKLGIPFGAYHFCRGGDARKEAEWFLKNSSDCAFLVCDWEIQHADPVGWCKTFCDRVAQAGKPVVLYLNESTVRGFDWTPLAGYPLWVSKYGQNTGTPGEEPRVGVWKEWTMWQFTSNGKTPGISGRVDLNLVKDNFLSEKPMKKEFVEAIEELVGKDYGDNLNEKEQEDAAKKLQTVKKSFDDQDKWISSLNRDLKEVQDELGEANAVCRAQSAMNKELQEALRDAEAKLAQCQEVEDGAEEATGVWEAIKKIAQAIKNSLK